MSRFTKVRRTTRVDDPVVPIRYAAGLSHPKVVFVEFNHAPTDDQLEEFRRFVHTFETMDEMVAKINIARAMK